MKKHLLLVIFVLLSALDYLSAQTTTVTFVGKSSLTDEYIRLYRVSVFNNSQHWEEILYYPDTTLQMQASTGIEEVMTGGSVLLLQNVPNPFDGVTDFTLQLEHFTQVEIEIYDINGRKVTSYSGSLDAGQHQFRATLTSPQTYLLSAQTSDQKLSIKMINEGYGADNSIIYLGSSTIGGGVSFGLRGTQLHSPLPFVPGDQMTYVGYIQVENTEYVSTTVQQQQWDDELIALMFNFSSPMVETRDVTVITANDAVVESEVLASGNLPVTARGVCYSTSPYPTIADSHTTDGSGTGSFTSNIAGLSEGTTYYVRAYATNSLGTGYGEEKQFRTMWQSCGTVTDIDGNSYSTVQIGEQCWMRENLRTDVPGNNGYPNGAASNWEYGRLYSWDVMMNGAASSSANPSGVQGICPDGWHVPSDAEWTQLTDYVSSRSEYCCDGNSDNIAKALASATGWNSSGTACAVGNGPSSNNATGFSALPAGYYYGSYANFGYRATFWSATETSSDYAYDRYLYFTNAGVGRNNYLKTTGYSVRCVRGQGYNLPTVTTTAVSDITENTAFCGGSVTSDGGCNVTARGVCWSTSHNPTIADSHTTDGSGTGSFSSSITGLTPNTTYYVRAYATNSVGTAYGEERSFTTNCGSVNVSIAGNSSVNYGSSVTLTANGAYSYHWSTGANTASITVAPTVTTTYSVSGTDAYGCTGTASQTVTVNPVAPTVTTTAVSNITTNSATSGGNVPSNGGANVTARGVCWSTSQNPTVSGSHTTDGSGTGSFSSSITGLTPNTTYYVRAYATNSAGTSYGEEVRFTTQPIPCGPFIYDDFNDGVIDPEFWTTTGDTVVEEDGMVKIQQNVTDLDTRLVSRDIPIPPSGVIYIDRKFMLHQGDYPYAYPCIRFRLNGSSTSYISINYWNTIYSPDSPYNGTSVFSDVNGQQTKVVIGEAYYDTNISEQVALDFNNGTISYYLDTLIATITIPDLISQPVEFINIDFYGSGWWTGHWQNMDYVKIYNSTNYSEWNHVACDSYTWNGQTYTESGNYDQHFQNVYGCDSVSTLHLTINPMPNVQISGSSSVNYGESVTLTATGADSYHWNTGANTASITVAPTSATTYSVTGTTDYGCTGTASKTVTVNPILPTVSTADFSYYNYTSVTSGGEVTADGGANVTARGVCWSTSQNPTISGSHTTDGSGTGSFSSAIAGLNEGTTYYVRAYATNSAGTSYGEEKQFRTWQSCGTVTDIDGNTYSTVQIGEQCWMRENLRTDVPGNNGYPNGDANNWEYGRLYSWDVMMNGASSSNANPSGVQGICPDGWHVPSDAEWTQLTDYVSSQSEFVCGGNGSNIAKALASTSGWWSHDGTCCVGNDQGSNNATGFSALPAGDYDGRYNNFGDYAGFWSATEDGSAYAYGRGLYYYVAHVSRYTANKYSGSSVRCLRGQGCNPVHSETTQSACGSYTWNGTTYTASGDYTWTGQTSNGCDSIVTLHLTINQPTHQVFTATGYDSYEWNGNVYTQTGTYTFSHVDANGCAQVDTLHLTIYYSSTNEFSATACEQYVWNNETYTVSGIYTQNFTDIHGADSTVILHLTINNPTHVATTVTECESYVWNGTTYTQSGDYTWTGQTSNGCDSIVTLHLTIHPMPNVQISGSSSVNYGESLTLTASGADSYHWNTGANTASVTVAPTASTTYSVTGTTDYGCTGTASKTVTVNPILPTVSTADFSYYNYTSVTSGGEVTADGGANVTARGVCWSTSQNPTISGSHTTDGSGTGSFTSDIDGLSEGTTYYVRAYATNSAGTGYGEEKQFRTWQSCGTVTDIDNNTYSTIQIGEQCWMRENLRTDVPGNNGYPNGDANNWEYGRLYSWDVMMSGAASSNANPSGVQGICPDGWHVPSEAEWTQLTDYVSSRSEYWCDGNSGNIAKALASTTGWSSSTYTCAVGNDPSSNNPSSNNATGFSALPAGNYYSSYYNFGYDAIFWSATERSSDDAYRRGLYYGNAGVDRDSYTKSLGYSVRCVRGQGCNPVYGETSAAACGSYTWHGQTYTQSGDYTWTGTTANGCDSIVTLHLTINNPTHVATTVTECESYVWNGTTYTQSGNYTFSHTDANGCTQVDTLHLTILPATILAHTPDTIAPAGAPTTLWTSGANFVLWEDTYGRIIGEENTVTVYPDTITTYSVIAYNTGANLVTNGDFEQGNTGFSTSYIFANTGSYKHYFIGQDNHQMWSWDEGDAIFDHTSGSGNWMMVDAYSGYTVWMQTVNVQPNTDYIFSAWFVTDNIANVRFEINGVSGELFSTPEERGIWRRHHLLWNSGDNASAQLKIVSGSATSGGNDFGVDDISFAPITTCENTDVIAVTTLPTGDALPCMGHETVTDIDGNTYNTVQIGDQCWMRENLRTTRYADNSGIALGNANSYDIPYRYVPNNNSQNIPQYGYLYNWAAVMHGGHNNNDNPSTVQGICPDGWHVPSSSEWDQLISYVSSVPYYCCNGNSSNIVKALASQVGWNYQGGSCSVGSNLATNNLTGFSAMPACYFHDTHGSYFGRDASFWSCTETGNNKSRSLRIYTPYSSLYYDINLDQTHGLSVRCVLGQGCNPVHSETSAAACETYTWHGQTYTQSGDYTWTGTTANGCDSIVTLHLTINQPTAETLNVTVTENSLPYHLNGYTYNAAGSYTQHLTNANGCDSTLTLNLTVLNNVSVSVDSTICDNDLPLIWNGIRFNNAGSQSITLTSANHTDSVVLMTLHVNESVYSNEEVTLCESQLPFSWHGTTYTQSGDYTWTGQTANGCDSIVTLHLTINRPTAETLNVTATENSLPYHLNGYNYNAAGSYTQPLTNAAGCDSTLTLNLTVLNNVSVSVDSTICDGELPLIWNGMTFNNAGSQSVTLTSANNTDSVVLMTLHVNASAYASEEATLCESQLPFSWHGTTYTQSGDYTWTGQTANGCDSIVTLHLTINRPTAETLNVTATENSLPYHLNGYNYNAAGSYTQHLTNAAGCDSTLTLNLTVLNNVSVSVDSTICDGDLPLVWNGMTFNNAGSQSVTLTSANNTDSVVLMTLHVNASAYSNEEVTLCESQLPFSWHGTTYTQSGDYTWTGQTANGCDSVVTLHLIIFSQPNINIEGLTDVCVGGQVTLTANVQNADGVSTYLWYRDSIDIYVSPEPTYTTEADLPVGSYLYSVEVANNICFSTASIVVTVHPAPEIVEISSSLQPSNQMCEGGTVDLRAPAIIHFDAADIQWHWFRNGAELYDEQIPTISQTLDILGTYAYMVYVTQSGYDGYIPGCQSAPQHINIDVLPQPAWGPTEVAPTDGCFRSWIELQTSIIGGVQDDAYIVWHSAPANAPYDERTVGLIPLLYNDVPFWDSLSSPGRYIYWPTYENYSNNNCWPTNAPSAIAVTVHEPSYQTITESACGSYTWHGQTYTQSGDYTWTGQTSNGCDSIVTLHLTINPMPNVQISGNSSVNYGESVTLTASGADSYYWNTGANTASVTVAPTAATTYSVTGTTAAGCTGTASKTVTVNYLAPTVTTADFSNYNYTSVTSGGEVTSDGGTNVTARGVCWSTSHNPTIAGSHTTDGSGTGSFSSNIAGLSEGTTYYVRAYATNSVGTSYGEEKQFRTWQSCGTVTDIDGNSYSTVQIGEQCWMRENLRTDVPGNNGYPNGDASNWEYGRLYNWNVMMNGASSSAANPSGVQGICPDGWHVPSDAEWKQLEMAAGMSQSDADCSDQYRGNIAAKLCGNTGWNSSTNANAAGNLNAPDRNSTGFSAIPAGNYYGSYNGFGNNALFWTATEGSSDIAYSRYLYCNNAGVFRGNYNKSFGFSVRCVRGQGCNPVHSETSAAACGSYSWHGTTYTQSGEYTWTGTTANGCDSIVTLHLTIHPMPNVQISGNSSVNYGSSVTLTASGADSYYWNTGANTASVTVAPTAATTYSVTGTTAAGCTGTASINVEVNELTLNDGLVLYLPMNGDLMDVSGFANNGTNNGASLTTDRFCQPNSAYEFPGVPESSKIIVPNNSSLQFSDAATFSMWFCMNGTRGMDGWGGTVDVGCAHALFAKNEDYNCIGANVSAMPNGEFHIGSYSGRNNNSAGDTCELIQLNQWVQATFVFTTSYMEVYVNGKLLSHSDGSMNFGNSNSKDLSIGLLKSRWYPFNGKIDEFRVYNRALNASEIAKLYYRDLIPKDSLVLFMPLDGNVIDHSDNNYQPVLHGNLSVAGDRFGVDSSAYHFPNDYQSWIEIPHTEQLNLSGTFTVSAWYNRAADGEYGNILSKGRDIESGWQLGTAGVSVNGSAGYSAGIQDDLAREQWYMTTGVMDATAGKLRYYLNGELMAETNCSDFSTSTTYPLAIGRHLTDIAATGAWAYPFKGSIDDIVIYHRALSDDEVMMLYNSNSHALPACEDPILCQDTNVYIEESACGSYTWHGTTYTQSGDYTWTGQTSNGCDSIVTLHLTIHPMPNVQISGNSSVNYGSSVTLTASGADSYIWSTGSMDNPITVSPTSTTTYNVIGATTYGCTGTASKTVTVNPVVPTVTTTAVSNITTNSATSGGNVTSDGGAAVTARGVCWSTSQNPTVSGSHTTDGSGTGSFTSNIVGLNEGTTYYVRAYATNSVGTSYGEEKTFRTWQSCGTVTDADGNTYSTVQIGEQCWMRENLRTTKYADNTEIALGSGTSYDVAYRYYPNNDEANVSTYGYLYNWRAVMGNSSSSNANPSGVQGICPDGWHVPSDAEWTQLTDYVSSQSEFVCGGNGSYIAKALASTSGWWSYDGTCCVGNDQGSNNATGFSALPAGYYYGGYNLFGNHAYFWSATEDDSANAYPRFLSYNTTHEYRDSGSKYCGFSVRCLRGQGCNPVYGETSASACGSYTWHGTTYTQSGDYTWTGQTANGCDSIVTLHLTIHPMPNVQISGNSSVNYGSSVTLTASGADSYIWSTGSMDNPITVSPTSTTTYNVIGATTYGCTGTASKTVTVNPVAPTVTTAAVSNITANSAACGGNVTSDGGANVTARGVCWSTSQNPTVSDSHTTAGSGTGSFSSSIAGLTLNTTYYVRAYATNSVGTSYGEERSFTAEANVPSSGSYSITTCDEWIYDCGGSSAGYSNYCDGSIIINPDASARVIIDEGTYNVEDYYDKIYVYDGEGTAGALLATLTNSGAITTPIASTTGSLTIRFASDGSVTRDGFAFHVSCATMSFTCGTSTVTDIDGNTYSTVQIGEQCWMRENLRTTKYADNTEIALGTTYSYDVAYRYAPDNNSSNVATYGYLYNWRAVMGNSSSSNANPSGVQGICPDGWHVPSDAEWTQLENYVGSQSEYVCGGNGSNIAKALASTSGWWSYDGTCCVGNDQGSNNATGFSALPAGRYDGSYNNFGTNATFWSATEYYSTLAYYRYLASNYTNVLRLYYYKNYGFSVRCVRD